MSKIKSFMHTILNIIINIAVGAVCSLIPLGIMYAVNQTSNSRIKQYGESSPQGIEAMKISKWCNIIGIIALIIIVFFVIKEIIKTLKKETDFIKEMNTNYSSISYIDLDNKNDDDIKVEENIWGEKVYKNSHGEVVAKAEKGLFGDEVIRDANNTIVGKGTYNSFTGKTTYQNNNYSNIAEKKSDVFGNKTIKTKDGKVYEEQNNVFGSKLKKK